MGFCFIKEAKQCREATKLHCNNCAWHQPTKSVGMMKLLWCHSFFFYFIIIYLLLFFFFGRHYLGGKQARKCHETKDSQITVMTCFGSY